MTIHESLNKLFEKYNIDDLFIKANSESLELATKRNDFYKMGDAHWNYGNYYTDIEVVDSAYYHFHKAYENFKELLKIVFSD